MKKTLLSWPLLNGRKTRITLTVIPIVLVVGILASVYLSLSWGRYQEIARRETIHLGESVVSLLHVEHIEALTEESNSEDAHLVKDSLTNLVGVSDRINYAYILKQYNDGFYVALDSTDQDFINIREARRGCEETLDINRQPFETGQSLVTKPIKTSCGTWIRALIPIFDSEHKNIIALLGLNHSVAEWNARNWFKMIPNLLIVAFMIALILTLLFLLNKNAKYKEAERSRKESERSKQVYFSYLPGMAYRCNYDENWTMWFVSEGSYGLTGYKPDGLVMSNKVSFNNIISEEYRDIVREKWKLALMQRKQYRDEYEIVTKNGERKWVLEMGQGIYNDDGNLEALEGIILDISEVKKKDHQIAQLRERDFLTGLYNRNFMEGEIKRLDKPEFLPLSVIICDIDGMRVVNNAYGYEEGDHLIVKVAQLINNCMCGDYVLGHTNGGEFMILLPNTDAQAASQINEEILNSIESYNRNSVDSLYSISLSTGFATKKSEDQDIKDVMTKADEFLRRRKMLNQNSSHSSIVSSIMAAMYAKSQETEEHGQRLGQLCVMIGMKLNLTQSDLADLQLLSKLHDIGKIGIEDHILNKPHKLTEEEWEIMKQHPEIGYRIAMTTPQLEHIAEYILYHHERWDGKGYPKGLKGEEIPIISRILSLADAFDAMTNDRVYRRALSTEEAIDEIVRNAGSQFDPCIAELFVSMLNKMGVEYLEGDFKEAPKIGGINFE